ncbi:MAG: hypothetical protein AAGM22_27885 [Acidobacteriota bacterium]
MGSWLVVAALAATFAHPSGATDGAATQGMLQCDVPSSSYPTIQSANDDGCDEVTLVAGDYPEFLVITRPLTIVGPEDFSAHIVGQVTINTGGPVNFRFVTVVVGDDPGLIFRDGFESGNTDAWSNVV